tara:strand:+ start:966 stop:1466 length:501 start_codon:yes stop_codon:yes gene_type:complete
MWVFMNFGYNLNKVTVFLLKCWTAPFFRYGVKNGKAYAEIFPAFNDSESVDQRIRKIDQARENLVSALTAVDELKNKADINKQEANEIKAKVDTLTSEKTLADTELQEIKKVTGSTVDAFQRVAGVPSRNQIAKERFVGFGLGVIASLLATLAWEKWPVVISWFTA